MGCRSSFAKRVGFHDGDGAPLVAGWAIGSHAGGGRLGHFMGHTRWEGRKARLGRYTGHTRRKGRKARLGQLGFGVTMNLPPFICIGMKCNK
jgi:hypothetical protein